MTIDPNKIITKQPVFIMENSSQSRAKGRIVKITYYDGSFAYIIQTKFLWWWTSYTNGWTEADHIYYTIESAREQLIELIQSRKAKREIVEYI